jgi:hypothetical protein
VAPTLDETRGHNIHTDATLTWCSLVRLYAPIMLWLYIMHVSNERRGHNIHTVVTLTWCSLVRIYGPIMLCLIVSILRMCLMRQGAIIYTLSRYEQHGVAL